MHFAYALPAWCGPDGLPLSWRHFVYGLQFIGRQWVREEVRAAQASRMGAQVADEGFRSWRADQLRFTEGALNG